MFAAKNDNKDFGRITVITQYLTKPEYCFLISPESFSPKPKVESVFIKFNPIAGRSIDDPIAISLQEVTRIAFMHKRKMVGKSLEKIISSEELDELGIDRKCRPENISVEDYVKIQKADREIERLQLEIKELQKQQSERIDKLNNMTQDAANRLGAASIDDAISKQSERINAYYKSQISILEKQVAQLEENKKQLKERGTQSN